MQKSSLLLTTVITLGACLVSPLASTLLGTVPVAQAIVNVTCREADIIDDTNINLLDYSELVKNFMKPTFSPRSDVNQDGSVNITDYSHVVKFFNKPCPRTSPTPSPVATPSPSPTPRVTPTPSPTPSPSAAPSPSGSPLPPGQLSGFWITPAEIMPLPTSGPTWSSMVSRANSPGTANLADQDSKHPESVLAMVLVATRTNNATMKAAAANELIEAIGTEKNNDTYCDGVRSIENGGPEGARGLAMGRNMLGYVVAADVLNFKPGGYDPSGKGTQFYNWVKAMRVRQNCPDNGGGTYPTGNWFNLSQTHEHSTSNGNALAGASRIAMAAYTGDKAEIDKAWLVFQRYSGNRSVGPNLPQNDYSKTWRHDLVNSVGINPPNSTCNNGPYPADGAIVNDQGRGAGCPTNVNEEPEYTPYPWEGMQGAFAQALIYDRLNYTDANGNDAWRTNNSAMLRAIKYQWYLQEKFTTSSYVPKWYLPGRADWVKHLANYVYDYKPANYNPSGGERNMDWVQWTHQNDFTKDQ